ncbi:unnamed protein product [Hymenolepis diminuta]|uniref:DUF2769 domain-containing protein n=1 Tax=Hymenolepis diminuta TaxID=6216 RepID=A0A0R3SSD8_HYMDI|nr:unnamed protein product [Hymenolepis diminuta]VUZ39296.1 unnamed protein product [Hymenolepis diminuta]
MCDCNKNFSRFTNIEEQASQPGCESRYRQCKHQAPCDSMTRPCSPCRPCCKITAAPNPIPPYERKSPFTPCGACETVEGFDKWSKKWEP